MMRHTVLATLCLCTAAVLSACGGSTDSEVRRAVKSANALEEGNLTDIMLTVAKPDDAVGYFQRGLAEHPDDLKLKRGLAEALIKAKRPAEGVPAWAKVVADPGATNDDRVSYADALIRAGNWTQAEAELNKVPPTFETYERYRLAAMVADYNKQWKKADSFYETAAGLTTTPANVLNNWGYSKLNRRDFRGAEKLFDEALTYDQNLYTAKNNLVMARAGQHNYTLPVVSMTQTERAQLLYTAGLTAVKQGDVSIGRSLLQDALDTSPVYYDDAARALAALTGGQG